MKYIDAEKLNAEIKRRIEWLSPATNDFAEGRRAELRSLYDFVAYLQQEQPEVDLEREIDDLWNPRFNLGWDEHSLLSINHTGFASIARYFYELGLNARK